MTLAGFLLGLHIFSGSCALAAAACAVGARKGGAWHRRTGLVFVAGMAGVFVSAVPLAIFSADTALLLIAVFSFYLAFAGWRFAVVRDGRARVVDYVAIAALACAGVAMGAAAFALDGAEDGPGGVGLAVFAVVALVLAARDLRLRLRGEARGAKRIIAHFSSMLGGTIAVITAVLVVNVPFQPAWVLWVAPTVVITPFIVRKARNMRGA